MLRILSLRLSLAVFRLKNGKTLHAAHTNFAILLGSRLALPPLARLIASKLGRFPLEIVLRLDPKEFLLSPDAAPHILVAARCITFCFGDSFSPSSESESSSSSSCN